MADNANEKTVKEIAAFIEEHNGQDTVVLNISELNSWTDYFIIATVTSSGHLRGLLNQLYLVPQSGNGLVEECAHFSTKLIHNVVSCFSCFAIHKFQ